MSELHVVTGAFGYSGRYIAQRLLDAGHRVRTLTASPERDNPFRGAVEARPFHWDDPEPVAEALRGAAVLYNTYWIRFDHGDFGHALAVERSKRLFEAAARAGVGRIVHTSITNPSPKSPFPYFRGKAELERALGASGVPHSILRPAVLFGGKDILINNIAWCLRRLPIFGVFGRGDYRLEPIHVDDFAQLAVERGRASGDETIDAVGPESFTYHELVRTLGEIIGKRRPIVSVPPWLGYAAGWLLGKIKGDVLITREEIGGLMADLLYTGSPPRGRTRLTAWASKHADSLGRHYASELARRYDRRRAYEAL